MLKNLLNEMTGFDVSSIFEQIRITEKIISRYKGLPEFDIINKCFMAFRSELIKPQHAKWMFESHCKEMANRLKKVRSNWTKEKITGYVSQPTDAEIVCATSECSFKSPLKRNISIVAVKLFTKICQEENQKIVDFDLSNSPISKTEEKEVMLECTNILKKVNLERAEIVYKKIKEIKNGKM